MLLRKTPQHHKWTVPMLPRIINIINTCFPCQSGKVRPADMLQVKAAIFLPVCTR
jgi:hypothetical protein